MTIEAQLVEYSINDRGNKIITVQAEYPLYIHAQCKTHRMFSLNDDDQYETVMKRDVDLMADRMFSRSAASNRAIPVNKLMQLVEENPAIPMYWGLNKPGMQADEEYKDTSATEGLWRRALEDAGHWSNKLKELGIHKQTVNRLLMPFQHIRVVVTATEWDNFFMLRLPYDELNAAQKIMADSWAKIHGGYHLDGAAAQPEMQELARKIKKAIDEGTPKLLRFGEWHSPYVTQAERETLNVSDTVNCSAARCARASFNNHDKANPDVVTDLKLAHKLMIDAHCGPFEHQATPMPFFNAIEERWPKGVTHIDRYDNFWSNNLHDWIQNRALLSM